MPDLARRLLQGAGAAGEQGQTRAWEGLGETFTGMRNTRVHNAWARFVEDFQAGRSAGIQQLEGKSLEEPLAAGGESKQAGLPRRGGAGACTGPVSGLVGTEQHSKAAIVE